MPGTRYSSKLALTASSKLQGHHVSTASCFIKRLPRRVFTQILIRCSLQWCMESPQCLANSDLEEPVRGLKVGLCLGYTEKAA